MPTPQPENENLRIQKLHEYRILDTSPEQAFDDIVSLTAQICGTPFAFFSTNTLVTSEPTIRFYAGTPIRTPTDEALGALGVLDTVPREFGTTL